MDLFTFLAIIISIVWIFYRARKPSKLPPGPYPFPIILALGPKPHQSLAKLSQTYGPIISLKLGSKTTTVVSSPETAKIVLQKHNSSFSNRTTPAGLLTENQWRKLRKIMKEQMFSVSRLDASQGLRREKLKKLLDYIKECSESGRAVDVGEAAFTTSLNLISATLFSKEFAQFNSDMSHEMKDLVGDMMKCFGSPNLADYFPILKFVDPQGITKQTRFYFERMFAIFDGIIDEKLKSRGEIVNNDMLEALIDINQRDKAELSRNDIKLLLLDLFVAGTDTTSGTVEWAMTELLRHPEKMSKVRDEIRAVMGENGQIEESDIARLPYLQAVVKETLRLHPPAPLLLPHKAESDVETNGYIIPKNSDIVVNIWASGRDRSFWQNADLFMPERFLNGNDHIDYRGKDFELIPFGSGRRMCPGLPMAHRMVNLMVATLVGNFGWKAEEVNVDEKFGMTLQKATPLVAVPTKL